MVSGSHYGCTALRKSRGYGDAKHNQRFIKGSSNGRRGKGRGDLILGGRLKGVKAFLLVMAPKRRSR
jgi:hypothetical protein